MGSLTFIIFKEEIVMENINNTTTEQEQANEVKQPKMPEIIDVGKPAFPIRFGKWVKRHVKDILEIAGGIAIGVAAKTVVSNRKGCEATIDTEETVESEPISIDVDEV
jgi:hypothetical protein